MGTESTTAVQTIAEAFASPWIILLGVGTLVFSVVQLWVSSRNRANLPPGPRNWPVIGALFHMEPKLHHSFDKLANQYGPIVYFRLGVQQIVVISTAEAAEELLKRKDAEFLDRSTKMTKTSSKYVAMDGQTFPFADYDDDLKLHRKLLISELLTVAKIKTFEALRAREVAAAVEHVFSEIQSPDDGESEHNLGRTAPVDVRETVEAVSRNVMFELAVGKRHDSLPATDELREFQPMIDEVMQIVMKINIVDFFPFLRRLDPQGLIKRMKAFEIRQMRFFGGIVERNRRAMSLQRESNTASAAEETSKTSFVQILLRAQEAGSKLSDIGIMSSVLSVLIGGIDTVGSQLEWMLLHLTRNPKVMKRLQDEIDAVVGKERPLEEADFPALPFLNAVVLETLRLNPVVPHSFPHVNKEPTTLCGYNIPAKTAVFLNIYSIGRNPTRWKDPLQFSPDRFMVGHGEDASATSPPETIRASGKYLQLTPFGSGRRMCPGYNAASVLLPRTIGALVHAFDWFPPPGCLPEDLSVEDQGTIILNPTPKVYLVPKPRLSSHVYKSGLVHAESM